MTGRQLVISASRRTDLPGFFAAECARRIRARISRLQTRRLYGVVFWTRHATPFLEGGPLNPLVERELCNPIVNLTVTGLGRTAIEPGAPALDEILPLLPALARAFHGEGWRIRWRFDPILPTLSSIDAFETIAHAMTEIGVETCTFSFPAYRSLKGDLTPWFDAAGIRRWQDDERGPFVARMAKIATPLGLRLLSCCQPWNKALHPAVKEAACIPRDLLERGHPEEEPLALGRDPSQRTHCNCVASEDIGDYARDLCRGGCAYCYSKAGGPGRA